MKEIVPLTSLRGLAALTVVMQHFSATAQQHSSGWIPSLIPHGYVGVDFFFVLSGFIMAYTYAEAFATNGWLAMPGFLAKRAARLMPLNCFVLVAVLALGAASIAVAGRNIIFDYRNLPFDIFTNLIMVQGLDIGHNLNAPSWSVSVEFAAYILFPLLVLAVFDRRPVVLIGIIFVGFAGPIAVALGGSRLAIDYQTSFLVTQRVARCVPEFILGMLVFRFYRQTGGRRQKAAIGSDFAFFMLSAGLAAMLLLRVDLFAILLFPPLIASAALNVGGAARALSTGIPYFLGVISYSIYMIHNAFRPLELALVRALHPTPLEPAWALAFAFFGSLSVIPFAWLTYIYVERPGRILVRDILLRGRRTQAQDRTLGRSAGGL
uniref:Acyltransferase n=1 Tax=Acidicaldus sp. TaxID=1872105 RepID=A0A8J4HBW8_9PROT